MPARQATLTKTNPYISDYFFNEVKLHVLRNSNKLRAEGTATILAIHGPAGTGKTFQLAESLRQLNITVKLLSSSDLESDRANEPAKLVRQVYTELQNKMRLEQHMAAALVINDLDAGLGDWGELVQSTENRQLVFGELMHICDEASRPKTGGNYVPCIFITANDLKKLYAPLLRPGRIRTFFWDSSPEDVAQILQRRLRSISVKRLEQIARDHEDKSVAFFVDAAQRAEDQALLGIMANDDYRSVIKHARIYGIDTQSSITEQQLRQAIGVLLEEEDLMQDYSEADAKAHALSQHTDNSIAGQSWSEPATPQRKNAWRLW